MLLTKPLQVADLQKQMDHARHAHEKAERALTRKNEIARTICQRVLALYRLIARIARSSA
jgi:hypothetical protein